MKQQDGVTVAVQVLARQHIEFDQCPGGCGEIRTLDDVIQVDRGIFIPACRHCARNARG